MTAQPPEVHPQIHDAGSSQGSWERDWQRLEHLDQTQAFGALRELLNQLPKPVPTTWIGPLAYWRGKCSLAEANPQAAVHELARCVRWQPQRAHAHYLLGVALSQQGQWLDAITALQEARRLQPGLVAAAEQQAIALQALGRRDHALEHLEATLTEHDESFVSAELQSLRWQLRVQAASLTEAPHQIAAALACAQRLSNSVLLEWVQIAAGLLLAGEWQLARQWSTALATPSPSLEACSEPLPRRLSLTLLLVQQLLVNDAQADHTANMLRSCLWWSASELEQRVWSSVSKPVLSLLWANHSQPLTDSTAQTVLKPLWAVLAPKSEPIQIPTGVFERCAQHLPALLELWSSWLERDDATWIAHRQELDTALLRLSELCLDRPKRLVRHPDPEAQTLAQLLQQKALGVYLAAEQRWRNLLAPAPARPYERRRWLILASQDFPQCHLYRVEAKQAQLQALGCECRIVDQEALQHWAWSEQLLWADALIVCRLPASHAVLRAITAGQRAGLPVYYDVDDLIFDAEYCPPELSSYGGTVQPYTHRRFALDVALVEAAMRACDGLIVSTPTLAKRWQALHPEQSVWVLPNLAPAALIAQRQTPHIAAASEPVHLVVASGTTVHKLAWQQELAPAIAVLLERYPQLRLDLLGHLQIPLCLLAFADRIRCSPYSAYPRYLQSMRRGAIGLVVLEEGLFTDAKSAIRWMEFSYLGLASVLSPTRTYTELLQPGVHALFARGTEAWIEQIETLILNPALRQRLAQQAQREAQTLFGPHQAASFWPALITPAQTNSPARRKLLLVHDAFSPNARHRGSRVLQAQLKELTTKANTTNADAITVLCSESDGWQGNEGFAVEVSGWNGVRVVRVTLPRSPHNADQSEVMARLSQWWLLQEGFDLLHVHGLENLTAELLLQARKLQIPYLISLHDRWWLQALAEQRPGIRDVLEGASHRLTASRALADLHQQAIVGTVTVMPSPWQPQRCREARGPRESAQPLRICYIAEGKPQDNGLAVVQAALLQAELPSPGIELTIVDPDLNDSDPYELQWGAVPVSVVQPLPIAALASEHDVVLVPTMAPESDAVLTREALSAGLWVICSDAGAVAEPIRAGINGDVVPAGDAQALARVLEERSANHPTPEPLITFPALEPCFHQRLESLYRKALDPVDQVAH